MGLAWLVIYYVSALHVGIELSLRGLPTFRFYRVSGLHWFHQSALRERRRAVRSEEAS